MNKTDFFLQESDDSETYSCIQDLRDRKETLLDSINLIG